MIRHTDFDRVASMGPGLFSPEDQDFLDSHKLGEAASMGPGLFSPEDFLDTVGRGWNAAASMGPGLFSPEDTASSNAHWPRRNSFNGAGLVQPGGQANRKSQSVFSCKLQWGRACSARRTGGRMGHKLAHENASMGPGLFSPEDERGEPE